MRDHFRFAGWRRRAAGPNGQRNRWGCVARAAVAQTCSAALRRHLWTEGGDGHALILPFGERPEGHEAEAARYESGIVVGTLTPTDAIVLV